MADDTGVTIKGEVSVDARPIEEVRDQLVEKKSHCDVRKTIVRETFEYVTDTTGAIGASERAELLRILSWLVPSETYLDDDATLAEVHAALIVERNRTHAYQTMINKAREFTEGIPTRFINPGVRANILGLLGQVV